MRIVVTLPYNPVWTELAWAKKHCPGYITNDIHDLGFRTHDEVTRLKDYQIDYFFANEKDALMFRLRWAK